MLENEIKQKERQRQKFQEDLIKLLIFLFTLLMIFLIIHKIKTDTNKETIAQNKIDTILQQLDKTNTVSINKYIVYGTHFNIEGTLELPKISGITVSSANIIAKTIDDTEIIIKSDYTYKDGKLSFSTSLCSGKSSPFSLSISACIAASFFDDPNMPISKPPFCHFITQLAVTQYKFW